LFMHIPGLKIIMPTTPYDAKGLLISAVEDGNPVIFIEHRWIYDYIGYVPEEMYRVPIGKGIIRKEGKDVTVVAISQMVYESLKASKILESDGVNIEIVDPRTLKPLDEELIFDSVKKTGRLVIADIAWKTGGVGAEIACRVTEKIFKYLKAPIKRVNFPDVPTPSSEVLENAFYVNHNNIINCVRESLNE
jgi:acetoin:2,6-dichlorophenolindophenol oxidoreductase subunit beta